MTNKSEFFDGGAFPGEGPADPVEADFGPDPESPRYYTRPRVQGPIPGFPCGGEGCFLQPVAGLLGSLFVHVSQNHSASLGHAATSGIELMKALRQFLDEEIALAEKAYAAQSAPRYQKIHVD